MCALKRESHMGMDGRWVALVGGTQVVGETVRGNDWNVAGARESGSGLGMVGRWAVVGTNSPRASTP
jgi:hypothetical protein